MRILRVHSVFLIAIRIQLQGGVQMVDALFNQTLQLERHQSMNSIEHDCSPATVPRFVHN